MSPYLHELPSRRRVGAASEGEPGPDHFSVILHNKARVIDKFSENSVVYAGKPVMWFSSIFGCQYFVYNNNNNNTIKPFSILSLVYSATVAILFLVGTVIVRPIKYDQYGSDVPFNVLAVLVVVIKLLLVFQQHSMTALSRPYYVTLFEVINDLDKHFTLSRDYYRRLRWLSIVLIVVPLLLILIQCTHYMRRNKAGEFHYFSPQYMGTPVSLVVVAAHTAGTLYTVTCLYRRLVMFNILIESKAKLTIITNSKQGDRFQLKPSIGSRSWSRLATSPDSGSEPRGRRYCWLELMQIYDKIADCFFLFNKIYASQVFVMLLQLLIFTLSTICRNMSPYLSKRSLLLRDMYVFCLWFVRPLTLGIISDLSVKQRNKIIAVLHLVMLHGNLDERYSRRQAGTMLRLVRGRPLAISAGVADLSVRMILQAAARYISYVILFIQYFYLNNT